MSTHFLVPNALITRAARVIAGDKIRAMAKKFGDVKAVLDFGNQLFRSLLSRHQKIVAGTDARCAGKSPGSVTRSMQAQLFRRIRVQEVGLQNTIIDDHSAARGHALTVEGT